ncbi:NlpC/P60 family protein [Sphingomonas floccifaciens]|uniref:NlpC/P60 family protein n=1 Tax=Sphingomonas floccifaciens TaxID=1844115 RepID=A0ABW4NEW1_9SPHN
MTGAEIAVRARGAVGTPFRLHGRGPDGLDCVGLVGLAYGVAVPTGYRLRSGSASLVAAVAAAAGLRAVADGAVGDLIVMASAPGQLHLAIDVGDGFVHADAGLRRVVERPGAPPWPVLARWRREEGTWRR